MGTYFNPGNESFKSDIRGRIYVDKTGLLEELNQLVGTPERCIALSHARRFGKSQAAGMIDAYYSFGSDSKEIFSGFVISKSPDFEKHLNKYNVIHLDMSSFLDFHDDDLVEYIIRCLYDEFKAAYDEPDYTKSLPKVLHDIYESSSRRFVIIIDEWDCVVRNCEDKPELVHKYLKFLHSLFKSEESKSYLALAYITGILPIKKIKDESALNNFREYTMVESDQLTRYFGFTKDEVKELCDRYEMNFESVKEWYDGYTISGLNIYNPNSVYEAMTRHRLSSYWKNTSSFDTINRFITINQEGLKDDVLTMLEGGRVQVNTGTFRNDFSEVNSKDDALTALIHLGYLGYDSDMGEAFIPNFEVSMAFKAALETGSWKEIAESISQCERLMTATWRKDADTVAKLVEKAHSAYSNVLKYNSETSLGCAVRMAYFTAPAYYNIIKECPTGKGFADMVMIPRADSLNKPAIIVELKCGKSAKAAIKQIKDRDYGDNLKGYSGEMILVGINYDRNDKNKKHECIIESVRKD